MKIGDVYVNKKDKSIIQIDSYATHMGIDICQVFMNSQENIWNLWIC